MRIALVAPPFIPVPPVRYGGTELYIGQLARGLAALGHEPVVYGNGESRVAGELRWLYAEAEWPTQNPMQSSLKNLTHTSWAIADAADHCDLVHVNDVAGVFFSRFVGLPVVHTLHHPNEPVLSAVYDEHPDVWYVAISDAQRQLERMPRLRTIHHGLDLSEYRCVGRKEGYVCFLSRIAPCKGAHLAVEVAKRAGVRLKIAGEIQPLFRDYWERDVKPHVDGRSVEYVGEADLALKNDLLGGAKALLFPIQWQEPFGLVMIEAMACGTPVVALSGGSVDEVVGDAGVVCSSVDDMVRALHTLDVPPARCRARAVTYFSIDVMARRYVSMYEDTLRVAERGATPVPEDEEAIAR